jgi:hypothetical protein
VLGEVHRQLAGAHIALSPFSCSLQVSFSVPFNHSFREIVLGCFGWAPISENTLQLIVGCNLYRFMQRPVYRTTLSMKTVYTLDSFSSGFRR